MASIRERNGSYQITVSCGRDVFGKKLIETTTFTPPAGLTPKKLEKAVEEFARKFEEKILSGAAMDGRKITLGDFIERWIPEYAEVNLQPGTVEKYQMEIDKILPVLGHLKLSEIRPSRVNAFYVAMLKGGRRDGKPGGYSIGTIRKTHGVLSSIMQTAVQWEIIDSNPCGKVRLPTGREAADRIKFFTPEQVIAFLDFLEKPYTVTTKGHSRIDDTGKPYTVGEYTSTKEVPLQFRVLFTLAIYAGLRKGELLALKWSDVDLDAGLIRVSKAVSVVNGEVLIKQPKTKTSTRTVAVPPSVTMLLRKLHKEQLATRLYLGDYWKNEGWLFTQSNGTLMNYSTPGHSFRDILERYNAGKPEIEQLPLIPFHGLRHTSATLLIAGHQDVRSVSARLGHAQASTTMNIYAHALAAADQTAADTLEKMLVKHA